MQKALDANDPSWRERELIIFPSHRSNSSTDIDEMIEAAHAGGFDAICASLIITGADDVTKFTGIWIKNWGERWTLPNPKADQWKEQAEAIGRDLWTWICRALAS